MPSQTPILDLASARRSIGERSFYGTTGNKVGVELEWFTTPSADPPDVPTLELMLSSVALPCGSALSFEPGGQVELSSAPFDTCTAACTAVATDSDVIRRELDAKGIGLFAAGSDPGRKLDLLTDKPRYVAMRRYFDTFGPAGGRMMCGSSAIHVNLDAGDDDEGYARWHAAHVVGPALLAAFANSPAIDGKVTGWKSSRFEAWKELDGTRTAPVEGITDPAGSWTDYVLSSRVMFIRRSDRYEPVLRSFTFADWIEDGHELGFPTEEDLAYHETTLFPPVRPRGWLELRMIDMVPDPWWRAAVVVATAVVTDAEARSIAIDACRPTISMWETAARRGLDEPVMLRAAQGCFEAALGALDRIGAGAAAAVVRSYAHRFVSRGRTPADEQLASPIRPEVKEAT
jgi:glutamate--cysteine ligase